ncbi:MAG: hypothetical protein M3R66_00195 [Actinomycetota bacterium]|nr:hypothetical protein [Actinomycetota bacterium]
MAQGIPVWWRFAPEDWMVFSDAVWWALEVRGEAVPLELSAAITIDSGERSIDVSLDRLAGEIHQLPAARWPAGVARYLADQQPQDEKTFRKPASCDIGRVRTLLRPRLLRRDDLPEGATPLEANVGADLVGVLEVMEPQSSRLVVARDLTAWGVPADELWNIALENLRHEDHQFSRQGLVSLVTGSGSYVASQALRLNELTPDPAPHGFLVALPNPALVLFLPLIGADWVMVLRELPGTVKKKLYGSEHGKLSEHVYWWMDGRFEQVGMSFVDNKMTIAGSERFCALTNRLLREAAGGGDDSAPA